jgi:putative ABC transport system permease protein
VSVVDSGPATPLGGSMVVWRLAVRDLQAHAGRQVLAFVAVAAAVAFVGATLTVVDVVRAAARDVYAEAYGGPDVVVRVAQDEVVPWLATGGAALGPGVVDLVAGVPGVAGVEAFFAGPAWLLGPDGEPMGDRPGVRPFGAGWLASPVLNPFDVVAGGRAPERRGEVAIDKRSADEAGLEVGDRAAVRTSTGTVGATIVGLVRLGGADSPGPATVVLFSAAEAAVLDGRGEPSAVWVVADRGVEPPALAARLDRALAEGGAGAAGGPGEAGDGSGLEAVTGDRYAGDMMAPALDDIGDVAGPVLAFSSVGVVVGALVVATSVAFVVARRRREAALLRAVGASRGQVVAMLVAQAAAVGVLASVAGLVAGWAVAAIVLRAVVESQLGLPVHLVVRPASVAAAVGTGVAATLAACTIPAWRAGSGAPLDSLRESAVDGHRRPLVRTLVGAVAVASGLALAGRQAVTGDDGVIGAAPALGLAATGIVLVAPALVSGPPMAIARRVTPHRVVGRLAAGNAARNAGRSALTAAALAIGLVVTTYVLVLDATDRSLGRTDAVADPALPVDLYVTSRDAAPLPDGVVATIATRPEVRAATGLRLVTAELAGRPAALAGVDPTAAEDLERLDIVAGDMATLGTDEVVLSAAEAARIQAEVGDAVTVTVEDGSRVPFRIGALYDAGRIPAAGTVAEDGSVSVALIYANDGDVRAHAPVVGLGSVSVGLVAGTPVEEGRAALTRAIADAIASGGRHLDVLTPLEMAARSSGALSPETLQQVDATVDALLALTVGVAVLGAVNTQVLTTTERRHEIALFRAVGATAMQTRAAIRAETLLVAATAALTALAVGIPLATRIVGTQRPLLTPTVPTGRLAVITCTTVAATYVAAAVTARRMTRHHPTIPFDT